MEVYFWRPRSLSGAALARFSRTYRRKVTPSHTGRKNFGDELGPIIVRAMLRDFGFDDERVIETQGKGRTFFSVGSVTHVARNGDIIWGSGVLGGIKPPLARGVNRLEIHAVRGPLTRDALAKRLLGTFVPEVFGDPAILLPQLLPDLPRCEIEIKTLCISHMDDDPPAHLEKNVHYVSANNDPITIASMIRQADFVISSSLHGKILSDAYGVPCNLYRGKKTKAFKFDDYQLGVDGSLSRIFETPEAALIAEPYEPPDLSKMRKELTTSFPAEVFGNRADL